MLVLSRKRGERLAIDTDSGRIWLTVVSVNESGKVKLGIDAPGDVQVAREELLARDGTEAGA